MTHQMTLDEQEAALRRQGFTEHVIARWRQGTMVSVAKTQPRYQDFPIRIVVPWSALISDNDHYVPVVTAGGKAKLILDDKYREAKRKTRELAQQAMHGNVPIRTPLRLHVEIWVPDNRTHDSGNFMKCLKDAMALVVYKDDKLLHDERIIRMGVDCDAPRAELTLEPV